MLEKKEEKYSSIKDNIWGADVANMQLISKFNKGIRFCYVHGILLWKTIRLSNYISKYFEIFGSKNQTKLEWIKVANFTRNPRNHD